MIQFPLRSLFHQRGARLRPLPAGDANRLSVGPSPRKMMRAIARESLLSATVVTVATLAGCATPPPASDPEALAEFRETNDPLEPTNRVFYVVNEKLDDYLLAPAARAYRYVAPEPVRTGVHNLLSNLSTPVV